jgi:hypothetical protein
VERADSCYPPLIIEMSREPGRTMPWQVLSTSFLVVGSVNGGWKRFGSPYWSRVRLL